MKRAIGLGLTMMSLVAACGTEGGSDLGVPLSSTVNPSNSSTSGVSSGAHTTSAGVTTTVSPISSATISTGATSTTTGSSSATAASSGNTTTTAATSTDSTTAHSESTTATASTSSESTTSAAATSSTAEATSTGDGSDTSSVQTSAPPGSGSGCGAATVCDDFEGGLDAWEVQPNSTPAPAIDTTKGANGSSSSLKVQGTSQQSFVAVAVPGQSFYFRAYMNFEQGTEQMNGHGWFIVGADNLTQGDEQQMRFGSSSNHGHKEIDFNVYGGSCGGEKTQFSDGASDGAAGWTNTQFPAYTFEAGTWYCVEGHFNGPGNEFQLWVNDEEVPGLHVTASSMCANWSPTYTHLKLGAGANSDIGAIWYDDVAVSTERVGCE